MTTIDPEQKKFMRARLQLLSQPATGKWKVYRYARYQEDWRPIPVEWKETRAQAVANAMQYVQANYRASLMLEDIHTVAALDEMLCEEWAAEDADAEDSAEVEAYAQTMKGI